MRAKDMDHNSQVFLLALLSAWGPAAEPAIPELLAILPRHPLGAGSALAAIAGPLPAAIETLSQAAAAGTVTQRLTAATTLRSLTGDDEPLLAAIEQGLRQRGYELRAAARAARTLSTSARRLVPALTTALHAAVGPDATAPDISARIQLALALWHHTGDAASAIPVLADGLGRDPRRSGRWTAIHAADAAAVIGAAAKPLIPAILPLLDDPAQCPAAVHALLRIDPRSHGGVDLAVLADRLVTAVGTDCGPQQRAVAALGEIGPGRLPPAAVNQLRHLAEQDQRIIRSGLLTDIIRNDERLRTAIRQLLNQRG